ncbi:hypothetical protein [Lactimicrobium massiliense]|uniref:hypothetical protein n=1 Tax=Lactimicrobium massiliense TaxID=2161814 RepID=UPI000D560C9E|nr:hypothetical protein [Lactimicrobium massiliense]
MSDSVKETSDLSDAEAENVRLAEQEKQAVSLYKHVKELAQLKYDGELRREDSLIQQSSHMQTAFSFMTAAVFMALPIVIEHRGVLTMNFLFISVSIMVGLLLVSLVMASIAQRRIKKKAPQNVSDLEKFVSDNWQDTLKESQQLKQWVDVVGEIQESTAKANDERVIFIRLSMGFFLASVAAIVICYIVALCKIL